MASSSAGEAAPRQLVFVELSSRWVAAATPDASVHSRARSVFFPARLVIGSAHVSHSSAGGSSAAEGTGYLVSGITVTVGGPPTSSEPAPFVVRTGTALSPVAPEGIASGDLEDALLCLDAAVRLGLSATAYDLVILSDDHERAGCLHAAIRYLAGVAALMDGEVPRAPVELKALGPAGFGQLASGVRRENVPGDQALLLCTDNLRVITVDRGIVEYIQLDHIYSNAEMLLLSKCRTLGVSSADIALALGIYLPLNGKGEDGSPVRIDIGESLSGNSLSLWTAGLTHESHAVKRIRQVSQSVVLVGPEARLVATALSACQISATLPSEPLVSLPIIAARVTTGGTHLDVLTIRSMRREHMGPDIHPAVATYRKRRRAAVRFHSTDGDVSIRLPTRLLDPELVQTLRDFASATKSSEPSVALLLRLLRVEPR